MQHASREARVGARQLPAMARTFTRHTGMQGAGCSAEVPLAASKSISSGSSRVTIDPEEVRAWAEARDGRPSVVKRTHRGKGGILRIDFPGFSGEQSLEEIPWDEFFETFEKNKLAFVYQEETGRGGESRFNKFVSRDSVVEEAPKRRSAGAAAGSRKRSKAAEPENVTESAGASASRSRSASGAARKKASKRASSRSGGAVRAPRKTAKRAGASPRAAASSRGGAGRSGSASKKATTRASSSSQSGAGGGARKKRSTTPTARKTGGRAAAGGAARSPRKAASKGRGRAAQRRGGRASKSE